MRLEKSIYFYLCYFSKIMVKESKRAKVLKELMKDGKWYSADDIREITGYKHPNRAITDLRQFGYIVEQRYVIRDGKRVAEWKLLSVTPVKEAKHRFTLSKSDARKIFQRDNYTCVLCKEKYDEKFLRVDHKIPISRVGNHLDIKKDKNWMDKFQTMCIVCNYVT